MQSLHFGAKKLILDMEEGAKRMNPHKCVGGDWIRSLVKRLDLVEKDPVADLSHFRALLEECQLPERIREIVGGRK